MHLVEKSRARVREASKMHFCIPRHVPLHVHYNLGFDKTKIFSGHFDADGAQKFEHD